MIEIKGLTRDYGKFRALDHLDMTIKDGELHGFVGPNGAGKTTTMRILSTLLPATSGTIEVDSVFVHKNPKAIRRVVGYTPDFFGVYDRLHTWEYLDFYARCYQLPASTRSDTIDQLLELVHLTDKKDAYVDILSRGMKQRLGLARALIHDPKLLVLDEPASGMDPRARAEMKDILRALRSMGKTVLISSHILPELSELCDSLTIIDRGKLVFSGSVEQLQRKMQGDAILAIRLSAATDERTQNHALDILRQFAGVTGITQAEDFVLHIEIDLNEERTNELLKTLIASDIPVVDFHRARMNLEQVFMEVTQA